MKKNILLVDDDLEVQHVLTLTLTHLGYNVSKANNGLEGFESFKKEKPDIILSDIYMPKCDGFEFLKMIRESDKEQEIVIITGFSDTDTAIRSLREGASDFIPKPIDMVTLEMVLNRCKKRININEQLKNHINNLEQLVEERTKIAIEQEKLAIIGRNTAGIIHNIANPLSTIRYRLEWDLMNCDRNKSEYEEYQKILKNIDEVISIIANTLAKLRSEAQITKIPLDINQVIQDQINFLEADPRFKHQIEIELALIKDLPKIIGIYTDFSQVFNNFFINAAEAMENSTQKKLVIKTDFKSDRIIIRIEDTGCGISNENKDKIFNPLFSSKFSNKGTGLGLSVVKQLLEPYDAKIEVDSEINKGTIFQVIIPYIEKSN